MFSNNLESKISAYRYYVDQLWILLYANMKKLIHAKVSKNKVTLACWHASPLQTPHQSVPRQLKLVSQSRWNVTPW